MSTKTHTEIYNERIHIEKIESLLNTGLAIDDDIKRLLLIRRLQLSQAIDARLSQLRRERQTHLRIVENYNSVD